MKKKTSGGFDDTDIIVTDVDSAGANDLTDLIKVLEGTRSAMDVFAQKERILRHLRRLDNG